MPRSWAPDNGHVSNSIDERKGERNTRIRDRHERKRERGARKRW